MEPSEDGGSDDAEKGADDQFDDHDDDYDNLTTMTRTMMTNR